MPLNIKNSEVHERAKELARITGTSLSDALERERRRRQREVRRREEVLMDIAAECARLPVRYSDMTRAESFFRLNLALRQHTISRCIFVRSVDEPGRAAALQWGRFPGYRRDRRILNTLLNDEEMQELKKYAELDQVTVSA